MKTAIIAPSRLLGRYAVTGYHLALCHLVDSDRTYGEFYAHAAGRGDFIILDNSAHELGEGLTSAMERSADMIMPDEVVLPDRLFNAEDTVDFGRDAINSFRHLTPIGCRVMGVPQGTTIEEWDWCCYQLIDMEVDTIGISKDYEAWDGGLLGRVHAVRRIADRIWHPRLSAIHMLGWGRQLWQLPILAHESVGPNDIPIRGVDSGKPLVYAASKINLSGFGTPKYPKRAYNFFDFDDEDIPSEIALININEFRKAANDL